jgi:hypothetical protein
MENPKSEPKKVNYLDFFDGEKGGVGKTFVAKTAIQYQIDNRKDFIVVEADRSNPDVHQVYRQYCKVAYFTENDKLATKADRIFELAMKKNTLVNLPSQVQTPFKTWFDTNNLFELGKDYGVVFRKWFVTNGEFDSINLFLKSLEIYGDLMPHFLVKNWGLCEEWDQLTEDPNVKEAIEKYKVEVVEFPKLGYMERYFINKHRLSFEEAKKHTELTILGKQRVSNFLKSAYAAFDETKAWVDSAKMGEIRESA